MRGERLGAFNLDDGVSKFEVVAIALCGVQCSAVRLLENGRQGYDFLRRQAVFLSSSLQLHGGAA